VRKLFLKRSQEPTSKGETTTEWGVEKEKQFLSKKKKRIQAGQGEKTGPQEFLIWKKMVKDGTRAVAKKRRPQEGLPIGGGGRNGLMCRIVADRKKWT